MCQESTPNDPFASESQEPQKPKRRKKPNRFLNAIKALLFRRPSLLMILFPVAALAFMIAAPTLSAPAGIAVGSWEGVTEGLSQGYKDGEAAGLSAEDTTVKIGTKLTQTGKLQVLLLDLKLSDIHSETTTVPVVNAPITRYATLLSLGGEGVFTVDLTQSNVTDGPTPGSIIIEIPHPEFTPYLDDSTIETIAEYKSPVFDGTTKNGYTGWLNTRDKLDEKVQSELLAYDALVERAKASAQKQVELIAQSICGNASTVEVRFIEEG